MRSLSKILILLLCTASPVAFAADSGVTVNGKAIKQPMVDYILKEATAQATARGQKLNDNAKALVVDRLIANEVVYQEAQRVGIDKQPDFLIRNEMQTREMLIQFYYQDYLKKNPTDENVIKSEYEKFKTQWGDKEYKASHILVKTEQEAKDIIEQLSKKADFAKLAKEKSLDASKEKGGDLGWFPPARMVKPFADAVTKLPKGVYTTVPVQSQFGWHVIRMDDVRDAPPPSYDTVKDELRAALQKQEIDKLVNELRSKAKVVDNSATAAPAKNKK